MTSMNHCLECGQAFHRDYDSQYTARANGFCGIECRGAYTRGDKYYTDQCQREAGHGGEHRFTLNSTPLTQRYCQTLRAEVAA